MSSEQTNKPTVTSVVEGENSNAPDILALAVTQQTSLERNRRDHVFLRQQGSLNWVRRGEDGRVLAAEFLEWESSSFAIRKFQVTSAITSLIKSVFRMLHGLATWVAATISAGTWIL
jgi:hypothetical protein